MTHDWRDVGDGIQSRAGVFSQIHSGIKIEILFLRLFAILVQWNDLSVLPHSFDRRPATLIRSGPLRRNIFAVGNLREFFLISVQPSNLFHLSLNQICVHGVGRIVGHLG
jgi:hypothetical protein